MSNETGIIRIIKARMIEINKELARLRQSVSEKENELHLARLALRAIRENRENQKPE